MTEIDSKVDTKFEALLEYIKDSREVDFTGYKRNSLFRRVKKRMDEVSVTDFAEYIDYLEVHPDEFKELLNTILINVTSFFRDKEAWEYLDKAVLPEILSTKESDDVIRVWSAGCASGEEPFSLLMLIAEHLGGVEQINRIKIYATDIDEDALSEARAAKFSESAMENVPEALREKYFNCQGTTYSVKLDVRRAVIFGRHDLVKDAPIPKLDLLVCRNALMYMNIDTQSHILPRFHFALNDSGYLFLGKAELMLTDSVLFQPIDIKNRIFKKTESSNYKNYGRAYSKPKASEESVSKVLQLREAAFEYSQVAELLLDREGKLLLVNKMAANLFGIDRNKLGIPFQDLELSYRPVELRSVLERCYKNGKSEKVDSVRYQRADGNVFYFDVTVVPLNNTKSLIGASITFCDVSVAQDLHEALISSNEELETTNEELQSAQEELETTNEELQSTNEELETTNEELQSTNEELETMNEELQSTNEELETMNNELRSMSSALTTSNKFLASILTCIDSSIIVVNRDYEIVLWNDKSFELWGLREDEIRSQSLFAQDIGLPVDKLKKPINSVLTGKKEKNQIVLEVTNRRGQSITCDIIVTPVDDQKSGVVLMITPRLQE